jgi:hypothetical protein
MFKTPSMDDLWSRPPYSSTDKQFEAKYKGSCYCGAVTVLAKQDPVDAKICHCRTCQTLHGAPMQWAAIFHKHDILITQDSIPHLLFYNSELMKSEYELPCKIACSKCRSLLADEGRNMMLIFPTIFRFQCDCIPDAFKPTCHIFYGQHVISIKDGAPKYEGHKEKSAQLPE